MNRKAAKDPGNANERFKLQSTILQNPNAHYARQTIITAEGTTQEQVLLSRDPIPPPISSMLVDPPITGTEPLGNSEKKRTQV